MSIMIIISGLTPRFIINKEAIKNALSYGGYSFEEQCIRNDFDYELFKRVYNGDLNLTIKELIHFANTFEISLNEFIILC